MEAPQLLFLGELSLPCVWLGEFREPGQVGTVCSSADWWHIKAKAPVTHLRLCTTRQQHAPKMEKVWTVQHKHKAHTWGFCMFFFPLLSVLNQHLKMFFSTKHRLSVTVFYHHTSWVATPIINLAQLDVWSLPPRWQMQLTLFIVIHVVLW